MKAVLVVVLLAVLAGAVYFAVRQTTGEKEADGEAPEVQLEGEKKTPWHEWVEEMEEAGAVEPEGTPEFDVDVELEMDGDKPRLHFHIREVHGWGAAGIYVDFWHQSYDEDRREWAADSRPVRYLCRKQLYFNETMHDFTTPLPIEFPGLEGDWGTSEHWVAEVGKLPQYIRAPKQ